MSLEDIVKLFQGICWVVLISMLWVRAIYSIAYLEQWRQERKEKKLKERRKALSI